MRITLVASQNGLGHSRRLLHLSQGLLNLGCSTKLLIGYTQYNKLKNEIDFRQSRLIVKVVEPILLDGPFVPRANNRVTDTIIDSVDRNSIIISDNLVFDEKFQNNYYLHGHFSWIDYYKSGQNEKLKHYSYTQNIVKWFTLDHFQISSILDISNIIRLSFFKTSDKEIDCRRIAENVIWVAKGITEDFDSNLIAKLQFDFPDFEFLPMETYNFKFVNYLPRMIIGRPGLGTIRDCLQYAVPFLPVEYLHDFELERNVLSLIKLGLIEDMSDFDILFNIMLDFTRWRGKYKDFWELNSIELSEYCQQILQEI